MRELLLATGNRDKIREISDLLSDLPFRIITTFDRPALPEVVEDQETLEGNAAKKALTLAKAANMLALADDTGLMVPAIGGEPGVFSSRYAGENVSYEDNCKKLVARMEGLEGDDRTAYFETVVAIASPDGLIGTTNGRVDGIIIAEGRGEGGFGYDPLFYHPPSKGTFAEIPLEQKNRISHRGLALAGAKKILARLLEGHLESRSE